MMKPMFASRWAALCALALAPVPQAFAQALAEPPPQTRTSRNADAEKATRERATGSHGHNHGTRHGRSHGPAHRHEHSPAHRRQHENEREHGNAHGAEHDHGAESENIFGFTLGSDTHPSGENKLALETVARTGKRSAAYLAVGQKLEFAHAFTNDLSMSFAVLGDHHRIRARKGYEGDVEPVGARYLFNGFGGELRYRFLNRSTSPFGFTMHIEPVAALSDEASGLRGRKYGSENKLIFDRDVIRDALFVALNLTHEIETTKETGAATAERSSVVGASLAGSWQVRNGVFLGAETRYLRAYDGLSLASYRGDAVYIGPTLTLKKGGAFANLAYSGLVGGKEKGAHSGLDLTNFERHQIRIKAGFHF